MLTLKRIQYFWYMIPEEDRPGGSRVLYLLHIWAFLAALGLAVLGVCWPGEKFDKISLLLLFFAIYPALFYLTHMTHYRHRFHIEPFLLILSSRGLHHLWGLLPLGRLEARHVRRRLEGPSARTQG
jgi:hypothetical protein